jgi:AraC-like DNA-binding protein
MNNLFAEFGTGNLPRLPLHKNPGLEIVLLHRGHLLWECQGKQENVCPDSLYFTLPWQEHGSTGEFEPGHEWSFVVLFLLGAGLSGPTSFDFPSELGFDDSTSKFIRNLLVNAPRHVWSSTPLFRVVLSSLVAELSSPGLLHRPRTIHLTAQLILELAAILEQPENNPDPMAVERLPWLLQELRQRCDEPWELNDMASLIGLKHSRFTLLFHRYTGDSPLRYLRRLRVEKARFMLRSTSKPITWIALECGFCSSQHFARVFREFTGVTAQQYRQNKLSPFEMPRIQ